MFVVGLALRFALQVPHGYAPRQANDNEKSENEMKKSGHFKRALSSCGGGP